MENRNNSLTLSGMSDEELIGLCQKGDLDAEETLITRYTRIVRSISRPYFLVGGDSEDLIQEGMMGLLNAIRHYDQNEKASFQTFAILCIRRRIFSAMRKSNGSRNVSLDDCLSLESSLFDETLFRSDNLREPEELLIDREEAQKRYRNLLLLLSDYEQSVLRCFLRGMSYREIAERTGHSEKAVDNAIQRIRRKIEKSNQGDLSIS